MATVLGDVTGVRILLQAGISDDRIGWPLGKLAEFRTY